MHLFTCTPPPPPPFSCSPARPSRPYRMPASYPCCTPKPPTMVRMRGGDRYRPRVQTRSPTRGATGTSRATADISLVQGAEAPPSVSPATAIASTDILEEPQGAEPPSRRYNTRVGPRPPSHVHPQPPRRAPPSKRARTSGSGESSRSRPKPSQSQAAQCPARSSPQLSLASRIRVHYFTMTRYPRMWIVVLRTFTKSPIMIYQHWQRIHGSEILCGWSTGIRYCHL